MARKAPKPQPVEPEDESQEQPEPESDQPKSPGGNGKAISKAEAIRRAVDAGHDQPEDGIGYIRSMFGLDVTKAHFSADKSKLKSKGAGKTSGVTVKVKRGRKPKETASTSVEGYVAPPKAAASNGEADLLAALEAMKPLVASMGADKVHRLVDLLG